jgi:hypothetical protein
MGEMGDSKAAINPMMVIGATKGAATILAIIEIGDRYPDREMITGRQRARAAMGIARTTAIFRGSHR